MVNQLAFQQQTLASSKLQTIQNHQLSLLLSYQNDIEVEILTMGASNSKSPRMKKSSSSSAAFGRIRIDSPEIASPARRRLKLRRQQVGAENAPVASKGAASPIFGHEGLIRQSSSFNSLQKAATAGAGEKSPLLMPQKYQQQQRQLGSHGAIQGSDDYGLLANISPGSSPMNNLGTIKDASLQEAVGSPPLLVWIGPALFCALCYALYNIFIKVRKLAIV